MILLWFMLGILLIFVMARYNESNKLFWQLLFSFVIGFAGAKMVLDTIHSDEKSNDHLTQVCPTQVPTTSLSTLSYYITSDTFEADNVVTAQKPVSQGITPVLSEMKATPSEIFGRTRDQPKITLIKPPELCLVKDFSTHHDAG